MPGVSRLAIIGQQCVNYDLVKDKSFDQLKEEFSLVTIKENSSRVNRIVFNIYMTAGYFVTDSDWWEW